MRRWTAAILPALLAAGWLLSLFAPLLSPEWALGNRDIPVFHLPLRSSFRALAAFGLPVWNPWVHGGQPILSNPSYAAFYPPSWLVFLAPPHYALTLMALLHAAVAFAGAWRLARHFGCGRGTAALAGTAYVGCGAYLSLLSAFTLFTSMAWFPWVLAWGDAALRRPPGQRWWRPALLCGGALGLQLLNGEPSTVLMSGFGLLALALSAAGRRLAAAPRIVVPVLFGVALAAVQLLPTLSRLAESVRRGLLPEEATVWSLPSVRLVEVFFPRFFGDFTRKHEGLFFGWTINDRGGPYVESLYPSFLLALLGVSALIRWRIPRRAVWGFCIAVGFLLALGRHDPAHEVLRRVIPGLAALRYPEKFAVLVVLSLAMAGILGWQRLLDERQAGNRGAADLPLALALIALTTALTVPAVLYLEPRVASWWIATHGAPGMSPEVRAGALGYLWTESWMTVTATAAAAVLLALCRWRRPSRRMLETLAILLVAADLWYYGHGLPRRVPASIYRQPPPLAIPLLPPRHRLYVQPPLWAGVKAEVEVLPLQESASTMLHRTFLARLEPYAGLLWGLPYALEVDFDLMLTTWGQRADGIAWQEWKRPERANRFLGAWNIGTLLLKRTSPDQPPATNDPAAAAVRKVDNPHVLPRFRFVPRVTFHPNYDAALVAALSRSWGVARHEHCVRAERQPETLTYRRPPHQVEIADEGGRIRVRYRSEEGAFFVAALTFDEGWRARVDGKPVAVCGTAAGQMGVALPPGGHRLTLEYREPLLGTGAAVTLAALAFGATILLWPRRPTGSGGME